MIGAHSRPIESPQPNRNAGSQNLGANLGANSFNLSWIGMNIVGRFTAASHSNRPDSDRLGTQIEAYGSEGWGCEFFRVRQQNPWKTSSPSGAEQLSGHLSRRLGAISCSGDSAKRLVCLGAATSTSVLPA